MPVGQDGGVRVRVEYDGPVRAPIRRGDPIGKAIVQSSAGARPVEIPLYAGIDVPKLGPEPFHAVFIRAPVVASVGPGVEVLAKCAREGEAERAVAVRQGHLLATSFHPELTNDTRMHKYFLDMVSERGSGTAK